MMIYDWTRIQSEIHPQKIAISSKNRHRTYAMLESDSNRLASLFLVSNLKAGDRVGLMLDTTPENITAIHGVSKAGGVNVPVDLNQPVEKIAEILEKANVSFIMVDPHSMEKYQKLVQHSKQLEKTPWIWWSSQICTNLDQYGPLFSFSDLAHQPNLAFHKNRDEDSPAFIHFDAEAEGDVKGISISHRNISKFITWSIKYFGIKKKDRIAGYAPAHSQHAWFDYFSTFASGAHLYLMPEDVRNMPNKTYNFLLENDITQWFADSSIMNYMAHFGELQQKGFPGLERVIWHGKKLPISALKYWMKKLPHVQFTNLNGPAEATIASCYYTVKEIPSGMKEIPLGRPCRGDKLYVLNDELKPTAPGGIGDLYISGDGLSAGYIDNKEKNEIAFTWFRNKKGEWERIFKTGYLASFNSDGMLYYHGKSDYKIKKRPFKLDLNDVEAALGNVHSLQEYAVVPIKKAGVEKVELGCAYVSAHNENDAVPPILKNHLLKAVPNFMIPSQWKAFKKLPRNRDGKIDRKTLSEEFKL